MRKENAPLLMRTSIRLSLQFSLLYAVLSALVFAAAYWFTYFEVKDWVLDQMLGTAETLTLIYESDGPDALAQRVEALGQTSFENAHIFQLIGPSEDVIAGNVTAQIPETPPAFMSVEALALSFPEHDEVEGYWMRKDIIGPFQLIQGSGDHLVGEVLEALGTALLVGFPCVILLGLIAGARVGRMTEQRIADISSTLSSVSGGQLNARIVSSGPRNDDLSRVSIEINAMLDHIERLLESQEQISNDIAHDMRTPLQRLRQRLEVLRSAPDLNPQDIEASLEQTDDIISTFNALLRIAQIEAVNKTERFALVEINQIIKDVVEIFEPLAEDKGMGLTFQLSSPSPQIIGDRELLIQLVVNLVENAITHCPPSTQIEVSASASGQATMLSVSDDGPGIDADIREKVLQRFFQAEDSRTSSGNGLGLALVKAVADIHEADIRIAENDPGTLFQVSFFPDGALRGTK